MTSKQAQGKLESLRPLNIVVPVDPQNIREEWRPNMAASVPSPKQFPVLKNDTKSAPGKECFIYRLFRVAPFAWILRMFLDTF